MEGGFLRKNGKSDGRLMKDGRRGEFLECGVFPFLTERDFTPSLLKPAVNFRNKMIEKCAGTRFVFLTAF